mmetsp:Transcript_55187/g.91611  ORF Transcript_55187/g.91611 Transcript_55187/m.91611 type:complete len:180 (+) Transcript_55187:47-586(+)
MDVHDFTSTIEHLSNYDIDHDSMDISNFSIINPQGSADIDADIEAGAHGQYPILYVVLISSSIAIFCVCLLSVSRWMKLMDRQKLKHLECKVKAQSTFNAGHTYERDIESVPNDEIMSPSSAHSPSHTLQQKLNKLRKRKRIPDVPIDQIHDHDDDLVDIELDENEVNEHHLDDNLIII